LLLFFGLGIFWSYFLVLLRLFKASYFKGIAATCLLSSSGLILSGFSVALVGRQSALVAWVWAAIVLGEYQQLLVSKTLMKVI